MNSKRVAKGFTLIELMIVVAIVAILAAIAYPSYQEHVRKTRRAQARVDIMQTVQLLERYYSARNTYVGFTPTSISSPPTGTAFYTLTVAGPLSASAFTISAEPQGAQADDKCGTLTINQAGSKGQKTGMTVADCW
ncbi:type IV pilin protein [Denitratimonas sp. CY0512]|uniref:type IV pilin protein n=1 Tax=Denitratimonas sp. CY0512 TaxID=3131940 RepID=UPI0030A5E2B5